MSVTAREANDLFHSLLRVQKLLLVARNTAPLLHDEVEPAAYPVLFFLACTAPARISDIAASLHSDISTVSRQVSAFASHGLVAKEPDPHDGRAQVITLTDAGHRTITQIQSTRAAWFQQLLEGWDSTETAIFAKQLDRLSDALDSNLRARGTTPPPMTTSRKKED